MDCFNCGEKLNKSDIFCIKCGTPVLTEDDIMTIPVSNYASTAQRTGPLPTVEVAPETDTMRYENGSAAKIKKSKIKPPKIKKPGTKKPGRKKQISEHVDNEPLADALPIDEHAQGELSVEKHQKSNYSRAIVITSTIIVCFALIGVGLYFLIRTAPEPETGAEFMVSAPVAENAAEQPDSARDTIRLPEFTVTGITIITDGHIQTTFHTTIDGTVDLQAQIEPAELEEDIIWYSSDPDVLEVVQIDGRGTQAQITGRTWGVADIIVSAGGFEAVFPVSVDDYPMHLQLESAIENGSLPIWITMTWTDGENAGKETFLERDEDTQVWRIAGATGLGEVKPVFSKDSVAFMISLPDESKVFYLFAVGTGQYKEPGSLDVENFDWEFSTYQPEPEG